jgi:hypothetical protein
MRFHISSAEINFQFLLLSLYLLHFAFLSNLDALILLIFKYFPNALNSKFNFALQSYISSVIFMLV